VKLVVEPYGEEHVEAVRAFNRRLSDAGFPQKLAESPTPKWLPPTHGVPIRQEYYVARDGADVRGGYTLKPQPFVVRGEVREIADYRFPLSEGIADRRFGMLAVLLLKDALRRQPLLFGLGMGARSEPVARLFGIFKWSLVDCPFFFRVHHPRRFLRGIVHLRRRPARRVLLDVLAHSGVGWAGIRALQSAKRIGGGFRERTAVREVEEFGDWCRVVWRDAVEAYDLVAVRDSPVLNALYPPHDPRFVRLRVDGGTGPVGWAVVLDTQMQGHKQFGDLRVGSIVDCLSAPGRERTVVRQATAWLERRGVDVCVSNQLHESWCAAFDTAGWLRGPSNFLFAASPALAERLAPLASRARRIHMTRGDGDGPIHL